MERFQKLLEDPHKPAREWKERTGGKVMGYFGDYFPEEVVYAAGVLPVRILSRPDADGTSQRYVYGTFCSYVRGILAQGLKGDYDYLDGIGHGEDCMLMRGAIVNWYDRISTPFRHYVAVPSQMDSPSAKKLYYAEMKALKKDMEQWTGRTVSNDDLDRAIDVYNTSRTLMRQVYQMRREDNPKIAGTEAMAMVISSQIMDKEEHNRLLRDAIDRANRRPAPEASGPRLMLLGSEVSDVRLIELIESTGASVVIDRLSFGSNYVWNSVIPDEDRLLALAYRYMDKPRSPVKDESYRRRVNEIVSFAIDYNVQGVVYATHKFCIPHQQDRPPILKDFGKRLVPVHEIEYDDTLPVGEFRTRLETFAGMAK
jgi:benzoyl-CoA reductase subunit C